MEAYFHAVAVGYVCAHPFYLVGVNVRSIVLDCFRQVYDKLVVWRRLPNFHHGLANLECEIKLGIAEAFGRILHADFCAVLKKFVGHAAHQLCAVSGDVYYLRARHIERHLSLQGGSAVVKVDDGVLAAFQGVKRAHYQMLPALGQDLQRDVVGD